ncbi:hypothetical protein LZ30DRAFT_607915 [Colletotrichum cereale]|nr:hypothetical protein LZ30DRAFT_607915 [Colletotrichum cereale]
MAGFFGLPRELRDMVYQNYVTVKGGYVCDTDGFLRGVLKQADGRPVDMALIFTCKRVAEEMRGLALRTNPITFSTLSGDDGLRSLAHRFQHSISNLQFLRRNMFKHMGKYVTQEAYDKLRALYPQYTPLLDALRAANESMSMTLFYGTYGEAPSVFRHFVRDVLQITHSCNQQAIHGLMQHLIWMEGTCRGEISALSIVYCSIEPWAVPSSYDMSQLNSMEDSHGNETSLRDDGSEWRLSAAAAAIYFLQSLPDTIRTHVRRLVVEEDQESVPHPESHGRGFIPLCRENPLLRVERRVNLWRNVFQSDYRYFTPRERYRGRNEENATSLDSALITYNVGSWIAEALALIPAGMPESSYSLVLDGNPVPQLCTRIFQSVVQRDVAWQLAWTESLKQGRMPGVSWFHDPRHGGCYFFEGLPQAVRDMSNGNSIVRCNFDPGEPRDVDALVYEHRNWTMATWNEKWPRHNPMGWDTEALLPSWMDLLRENVRGEARSRSGHRSRAQWLPASISPRPRV